MLKKYDLYIKQNKDKYFLFENIDSKHYIIYNNNYYYSYCYCLYNLNKISPSNLKYSRKIYLNNTTENAFNISDIHIEVDFELLGVNEYNIFFELFNHIKENIILNKPIFFIVCLHFNKIKKELLEVFYNFLDEKKIKFVFLTNQISFINKLLLKNCYIKKIKNVDLLNNYDCLYKDKIENLKNIIIQNNEIALFKLRELLYEILIYNYNIYDCFTYLFEILINDKYINDKNIKLVFKKYYHIIEKYNNNYRTIYHLEHFIIFLINLKNKT